MPALPFPTDSTPGLLPGEGEGRLVNAYAEKSGQTVYWRRVPGLTAFSDTGLQGPPRGMLDLAGALFAVYRNGHAVIGAGGGAPVSSGFFAGPVAGGAGDDAVTIARNNRTTNGVLTPDLIMVRSAGGAYALQGNSVLAYPDADLPSSVTSVTFLGGFFLFTVPDGRIIASGTTANPTNTTDIDPLSFATAESSTDALVRGVTFANTFFALGTESIEPWKNEGLSPFPLLRATSVIPVGLLAFSAIAGFEDGWGYNPFFVASDRTVRELTGYTTRVVSTPAVDAFINASDIASLEASVFTFRGRAHWCLTSNIGTWVYDVTARAWHERASDGRANWRASRSVKSNGRWLVGDRISSLIMAVDEAAGVEAGGVLTWTLESGPLKEFPARFAAGAAYLDFSPVANANVAVTWSHDGGVNWAGPMNRSMKPDGNAKFATFTAPLGEASHHGLRVRLTSSDPARFSFMGGTVQRLDPRSPAVPQQAAG